MAVVYEVTTCGLWREGTLKKNRSRYGWLRKRKFITR